MYLLCLPNYIISASSVISTSNASEKDHQVFMIAYYDSSQENYATANISMPEEYESLTMCFWYQQIHEFDHFLLFYISIPAREGDVFTHQY